MYIPLLDDFYSIILILRMIFIKVFISGASSIKKELLASISCACWKGGPLLLSVVCLLCQTLSRHVVILLKSYPPVP